MNEELILDEIELNQFFQNFLMIIFIKLKKRLKILLEISF